MKGISKTIYIITKIAEIVLITATIALLIGCIVLPFISNTFNITDIILLLIGISMVYIFKYGRLIQADTNAKFMTKMCKVL